MLGLRLVSMHNIRFLVRLGEQARAHILDGTFDGWSREWLRPPLRARRREAASMLSRPASRRRAAGSPSSLLPDGRDRPGVLLPDPAPVGPGAEAARRAADQAQEGRRGDDQRRHHRPGAGHQGSRERRHEGDAGDGGERHRHRRRRALAHRAGGRRRRAGSRPRHEPADAAPARARRCFASAAPRSATVDDEVRRLVDDMFETMDAAARRRAGRQPGRRRPPGRGGRRRRATASR